MSNTKTTSTSILVVFFSCVATPHVWVSSN